MKCLPAGAKRVSTLTICGVQVPVYRASVESVPQLEGNDGWFDASQTTIWLRDGQSESQERDTAFHELVHAFIYLSGIGNTLRTLLGPKRAKHWDGDDGIEETVVRQITPHLAALRSLFQFPKRTSR